MGRFAPGVNNIDIAAQVAARAAVFLSTGAKEDLHQSAGALATIALSGRSEDVSYNPRIFESKYGGGGPPAVAHHVTNYGERMRKKREDLRRRLRDLINRERPTSANVVEGYGEQVRASRQSLRESLREQIRRPPPQGAHVIDPKAFVSRIRRQRRDMVRRLRERLLPRGAQFWSDTSALRQRIQRPPRTRGATTVREYK